MRNTNENMNDKMKNARNVKDMLYEQVARIGKVFSSPKRLELIELLCQNEKTVETLARETSISVKLVSAHLCELHMAQLVETRREGKNIYYRLADKAVADLWVRIHTLAEERLVDLQSALQKIASQPLDLVPSDRENLMKAARRGEIDMLVTPDPLYKPGLTFEPVFDYEQMLVVGLQHPLFGADYVRPKQLSDETLITYPVAIERLDIYNLFLTPAGITPKRHKVIETTDIMLQMVASGRGVAALPRWLIEEQSAKFDVAAVKLGKRGVAKQIFLGFREADADIDYATRFR